MQTVEKKSGLFSLGDTKTGKYTERKHTFQAKTENAGRTRREHLSGLPRRKSERHTLQMNKESKHTNC